MRSTNRLKAENLRAMTVIEEFRQKVNAGIYETEEKELMSDKSSDDQIYNHVFDTAGNLNVHNENRRIWKCYIIILWIYEAVRNGRNYQ